MKIRPFPRSGLASEAILADAADRRTVRAALNYLRAKWETAPALRETPDGHAEWDRIHRLLEVLK